MTSVREAAPDLASGTTADTLVSTTGEENSTDHARALLDDPDPNAIARLWEQVEDIWRHRKIDPGLRSDILRVAAKIDPTLGAQLEREMDKAVPSAVLAAHQAELIPDRPALGAFPRSDKLAATSIDAWLVEDPLRLRGVVIEACRFCRDDRLVVTAVMQLAEQLGIDLELAKGVVCHALIDARRPQAAAK